ncbi:histidinol phosphatase-like PHP family hydrolase [Paraburkholderia sp. MM6662-R1]
MSVIELITGQFSGATFYRADLHIHSYGGSHDVADTSMTPDAIVATAVEENIAIVAITDHNEISNVPRAINAAARDGRVLVVAGVELSTTQGQLLCYFPDFNRLARFFASLNIADQGLPTSRCQQSIFECLTAAEAHGGFGILAHVDAPSGFENENPGASPHKFDVICHRALAGIELKQANSDVYYSPQDVNAERARMGLTRIERLGLGSRQYLARILNSDSHTLSALGRNAENAKRTHLAESIAPRRSFQGFYRDEVRHRTACMRTRGTAGTKPTSRTKSGIKLPCSGDRHVVHRASTLRSCSPTTPAEASGQTKQANTLMAGSERAAHGSTWTGPDQIQLHTGYTTRRNRKGLQANHL